MKEVHVPKLSFTRALRLLSDMKQRLVIAVHNNRLDRFDEGEALQDPS